LEAKGKDRESFERINRGKKLTEKSQIFDGKKMVSVNG
jgi:hypothetical protein